MPPIPYLIPQPFSSEEPLVSVFMFCLNADRSIRRAIESVLNQPYRNIELVVQDGLSTDGTLAIFNEYRDDRISWSRKRIPAPQTPCSGPSALPGGTHWKLPGRRGISAQRHRRGG